MIDWISVVIPLRHTPIESGSIMSVLPDGSVEWSAPKRHQVEGSYSSKFTIKSQGTKDESGRAEEIFIDGNPSKFLQGHNVFGGCDLKGLLLGVFRFLYTQELVEFDIIDAVASIDAGHIKRIDITDSIEFQNKVQVRSYIKQLSQTSHTRTGRPMQKNWTLMYNTGAKRWTLKVYSKGDEIRKKTLSEAHPDREFLVNEANRLCRVELQIRSLELKRIGLDRVYNHTYEKILETYQRYVGLIKMSTKIQLTSNELQTLSRVHRQTYFAWKEGIDVAGEMTRPTFYRHRAAINDLGVDISIPYTPTTADVIPLKTVVQGQPYQIPEEAHERGLIYKSEPFKLKIVN